MTRMLPTESRIARSRKMRDADLPEADVTPEPVTEPLGG